MIIDPAFLKLQAVLVDYASTLQADRHQEKIDAGAELLRTVHKLPPADALAQLLEAAELCRSSVYLRVNIMALANGLIQPRQTAVPAADKKLRKHTPAAPRNMGTKQRPDAPSTQARYWWKND